MSENICDVTNSMFPIINPSAELSVNRFCEHVKLSVGHVVAIHVSVYRLCGIEYISCDIESADSELFPITIAITGDTSIDEVNTSSGIELRDHTDAFLFQRGLMQYLNLSDFNIEFTHSGFSFSKRG